MQVADAVALKLADPPDDFAVFDDTPFNVGLRFGHGQVFEQGETGFVNLLLVAFAVGCETVFVDDDADGADVSVDALAAQADAEQQVIKARETLREQVAGLAIKGAEQILRKEVNAAAHADLLSRLKTEL